MKRIALVYPSTRGGVKSAMLRLSKGLKLEGFNVDLLPLGNRMPSMIARDLAMIELLTSYDTVLYLGSIPWPSHIFLENVGVFIHGLVHYELLNAIKHGPLRTKLRATTLSLLWSISRVLDEVKFFVCRSVTACEMNNLSWNKTVILPQFVLQDEIVAALDMRKQFKTGGSDKVRILTYTSSVESPRLLSVEDIARLVKVVARRTNRKLELIIVNPAITTYQIKHLSNLTIMQVKFMPKHLFLKTLASSDLYIERCIDEELGNTSIEAGLLGTPIAKITHSKYIPRQDYDEDTMILAKSVREFIDKLIEYINNMEYYREYYSKRMWNFITTKRVWDAVKHDLIRRLRDAE